MVPLNKYKKNLMMGGIMVESYIDRIVGIIREDIDKYRRGGLASIEIMTYQ